MRVPSHAHPSPSFCCVQAYDLDDQWGPAGGPCFGPAPNWGCCPTGKGGHNATTCAGREALCAPACAADADTLSKGAIHPRDKRPVGQRLGRAALNTVYGGAAAFTGPTLAGCSLDANGLTVTFNASLLRGDSLVLVPPTPYIPGKYPTGGSTLWVQVCFAGLMCEREGWGLKLALSTAIYHHHHYHHHPTTLPHPQTDKRVPLLHRASMHHQHDVGRLRHAAARAAGLPDLSDVGWRRRHNRAPRWPV